MNAIALCHNRDLQKTNGGIIVLGTGSISLMETATWVNMQPYSQSKWFVLHLDYVMVCLSFCLQCVSVSQSLCLFVSAITSITAVSPSIHPPTFLSQAITLGSAYLLGRHGVQSGWTDVVFCFWSEPPNQWSFSLFNMPPRDGGPCFVVCWL